MLINRVASIRVIYSRLYRKPREGLWTAPKFYFTFQGNIIMWLIPSNHPLYCRFAPELLASKEDWPELLDPLTSSLTWKTKPFSLKTFSRAWKRVYWLRHLCGRMLKPSIHGLFVEKYLESLEDIPVSPIASPATGKEVKIPGTFGRILTTSSMQSDLFSAGLKMSAAILRQDSKLFTEAFRQWVIILRRDCLRRRKLAPHICGNDSLSLPCWMTPKTTSGDYTNDKGDAQKRRLTLMGQAKQWPTPRASEYKGVGPKGSKSHQYQLERDYLDATVKEYSDGLPDPESLNRHGNPRGSYPERLNPAWVSQLMGTTLERIFFVPLVTGS